MTETPVISGYSYLLLSNKLPLDRLGTTTVYFAHDPWPGNSGRAWLDCSSGAHGKHSVGFFFVFFFGEQTGSPRRRHLHGFSRFSMWLLNLMTGLYFFLAWWVFCLVVGFLEDML